MMENEDRLVFVKYMGKDDTGMFMYDLLVSQYIDDVWEKDWDYPNPSICGDLTPTNGSYDMVQRIHSPYKLCLAQNNSCLSLEHCKIGIIALSYIDINVLEKYPDEDNRMSLYFGDSISEVAKKLEIFHINLDDVTT